MTLSLLVTLWVLGPQPALSDEVSARGPVTNLPMPRYVSIRAETANARRGPSLDHRVDWEFVRRGLPVQVVAEHGHWRRVVDSEGAGGWVHHSLLSGVRMALVTSAAAEPLHAGASDASAVRALVEPGVVIRLEECRPVWCFARAGGFRGWVRKAALWGVDPGEEFD